jgi:hypothetical protein
MHSSPVPTTPMLGAGRPVPPVEMPRGKMWVFAARSLLTFYLELGTVNVVVPVGIAFAASCWFVTAKPLAEYRRAGWSGVQEMRLARGLAVALSVLCALQVFTGV